MFVFLIAEQGSRAGWRFRGGLGSGGLVVGPLQVEGWLRHLVKLHLPLGVLWAWEWVRQYLSF